jgi:large subunit ribosomal protein L25
MSLIALTARTRAERGKGPARQARRSGNIPCVLYGHGEASMPISIGTRDFEIATRGKLGSNPIVSLKLDGNGSEYSALVREIQRDPVSHEILHVDFLHISLTESIEVNVSVRLVGSPTGVKDHGGILEAILREIKVRCLPTRIPGHIDVDVAALGIGDSVHVRDIVVTDVEILTDPDATVATVVPPTVIEEKAPEAAAVEAVAEPELITKSKKEEGAEEAEGAEKEKKVAEKKAPEKK